GGGMLPTTPGNLGLRFGGSNAFNPASRPLTNAVGQPINPAPATGAVPSTDQTGQYLQPGAAGAEAAYNGPHIIGNPFDNTLLIQATPDEYAGILKLLDQLDVPPRQVLIEAKVYEVDLTGNLSSGVTAYLQQKSGANKQFLGSLVGNATNLSVGMLVGETRELLAAVQVLSSNSKARVISAPSLIATDSMPATMNVGITVPVLTSTAAVPGLTSNNGLVFANSVAEQDSGVTLNMLARVNSSGIVTMLIDQEVSTPQASQFGVSTSPQFQKRSVTTQVTCQDGDTVAIGGIIQETNQFSTSGLPLLNRIPVLGAAFGSRSYNKTRTELIIFLTPRVIYDTNQLVDATDELRDRLKQAGKLMQ
ncbi:MAG TPA: hypothetical protein VFA04_10240, partial [Bryobacteraceae bacterium]|nr:hypothetical protein [Bryobacteraceae bacterium]